MNFLLAYDICDEKRLYKVRKVLEKNALCTQKSAFEAKLTQVTLTKLLASLKKIAKEEDKINFIKIIGKAEVLGKQDEEIFNNEMVIIL